MRDFLDYLAYEISPYFLEKSVQINVPQFMEGQSIFRLRLKSLINIEVFTLRSIIRSPLLYQGQFRERSEF